MTMTESGHLIEHVADQPKLTVEDIEEMMWSPDEMDKGWGREFQKCVLKYVEKPFKVNFEPDNAAIVMRLRDDGMCDPSVAASEWMAGKRNPKLSQARACQTCPEVTAVGFTDLWAERWDLIDLVKECEHDLEYAEVAQAETLVR